MTYTLKTGEINYIDEMIGYYERNGLDSEQYTFEVIQGRGRFNKVVATYTLQGTRSAAGFIDKVTGAMYRSASWSAPAKTRIV